jgi:uncharacterized protein
MSEPIKTIATPISLDYSYTPGRAASRFLRGIAQRKIVGERCPECSNVYVPPRGACPRCGVATTEEIPIKHTGTITTFCIVNVPFTGQAVECPYVSASIVLDGADIPIMHLIQEIAAEEVRMGMRVEAVWVDDDEMGPTLESIKYFRPTDEPDVPFQKVVAAIEGAD